MEFFLCGGGSGKQVKSAFDIYLNNINNKSNILYIPLAMEKEKYSSCRKWFSDEIKDYNIRFKMIESNTDLLKLDMSDFTHIFIGGGNTYKLLKELNQVKFLDKLKDFNGKVWGGSAGAIIFGKDINSCKLDDNNNVHLKNITGYNVVNNYSVLCHLNERNYIKNKNYLREYSMKFKTIYLPEEDVILIKNNEIKVLGNKKYIIFDNRKIRIKNQGEYI